MKLLITGSEGFIGKNLCMHLKNRGFTELLEYDKASRPELLEQYAAECDFVFHLAGINRPDDPKSFEGNYVFTDRLLQSLKNHGNTAPVLMSSSIQAELKNPYGESKKKAEELLVSYGAETGAKVFIYRLPGVFGKWCRPNYNSVVATFCDAIAKGQPVRVNDPDAEITIAHIDDVVDEFIGALNHKADGQEDFRKLDRVHRIKLGELRDRLAFFRDSRNSLAVADLQDELSSKLYSTYVSYLPEEAFSYPLTVHADSRGSFAEFIKSESGGQVSINISKPGITKGNHWHHTKTEKILVAGGTGVVRFKKLGDTKVLTVPVSGEKPSVVDIPPGYVHSITNTGTEDMVMVIWSNQIFDPSKPDTYPEEIYD